MTGSPGSTRPSSRFICSLASRERDEPMFATASPVTRWLLVEVRGSWGRDAVADSELGHHAPAVWRRALQARGIRIVAIRRDLDDHEPTATAGVRLVHVHGGRPGRQAAVAHRTVIADLRHVVQATEWLLADGDTPGAGWTPDADRYVLVCTNGRHDTCCATEGRPVVRHLRTSPWADSVWECSHVGGDRFAGNVVVLPTGLYFGRITPDTVDRVLHGLDENRVELASLRGRAALTMIEQAAEHFVRSELGLDGVDAITAVRQGDGNVVDLDLDTGDTVRVTIERSRISATTPLTCTGPPDQQYPTYRLAGLETLD